MLDMKISLSLVLIVCIVSCFLNDVEARGKKSNNNDNMMDDHNFAPMLTKKHNKHTLKQYLAKKPQLWTTNKLSKAQKQRLRKMGGSHDLTENELAMINKTRAKNQMFRMSHKQVTDLPKEFDARKKWGAICPSLNDIRDQSRCGSCWAVASASVLTDRACIQTKGRRKPIISATDLLACCKECHVSSNGCDGGSSYEAWQYIRDKGVVSGGEYNSHQGCKPYIFSPYDSSSQHSPQCNQYCENGQNYYSNKHYGINNVYPSGDIEMMNELYNNGPLAVSMELYSDLYDYHGGVYYHRYGSRDGGHLVRLIGWGEENGIPYWLVANSWGKTWGNQGTFKIVRGANHINFERRFIAASQYDEQRSSYY